MLLFEIHDSTGLLQRLEVEAEVITAGRLASSQLQLDHPSVARMHARFERSGDSLTVVDLGSASGTLLNGTKINKATVVAGDKVQLGELTLLFVGVASSSDRAPNDGSLEGRGAQRVSTRPGRSSRAPQAAVGAQARAFEQRATSEFAKVPAPFGGASGFAKAEAGSTEERFALRRSGPKVDPNEVESAEDAVEVMILWGRRSVQHVSHIPVGKNFVVGEGDATGRDVNFVLPRQVLGDEKFTLVAGSLGSAAVNVPVGAAGTLNDGATRQSLAEAEQKGLIRSSGTQSGARSVELRSKTSVRFEYQGFTFIIRQVRAGKRIAASQPVDKRPIWFFLGTLLVHLFFLFLFYVVPPNPSALSIDMLNADLEKMQYLLAVVEEEKQKAKWLQGPSGGGEEGQKAKDDEGESGKKDAPKANQRSAVKGPKDNVKPTVGRESAKEMARTVGVLGAMQQLSGLFDGPTSPFGVENALGRDSESAYGGLLGAIGNSGGQGGLGMGGTGRGGGGTGEGTYGVGNLGTIGGGRGGTGGGYGKGAGSLGGRSGGGAPQVRAGVAAVTGSLSKEVIRRVVNQHKAEIKFCYERELNKQPDLEGRVVVAFVISPSGAVMSAQVSDSTLRNAGVESCLAGKVKTWSFPSPDGGGVVSVSYPFVFSQT